MTNLILTTLPFVVTFAIAAWKPLSRDFKSTTARDLCGAGETC